MIKGFKSCMRTVVVNEVLAKDSEEQKQQEIYLLNAGDVTLALKVGCKVSHPIKRIKFYFSSNF